MELYIQIKDNQPFQHPIFGDNFRQAFPEISTDNLPAEFAKFERVACNVGPYDVYINSTYEWVDGIVKDAHHIRPMTDEEKLAKQEAVKSYWLSAPVVWTSWTFNENTCSYDAPTPYPTDGKHYQWNEASLSWVETV